MWKPDVVIPEHRWRARIVWAGLLLSIAAYTIWQVWKIFDGYNNISTSLEVTNELYEFPHLTVCFAPGQGCDAETDCAALALEGANVRYDGVDYELASESSIDGCIVYDLASLNLKDRGVGPEDAELLVSTVWGVSQSASTDSDYFNHVTILTSEGEPTEDNSSYLYVPFLRLIPSDDALVAQTLAEVTIGKTTKEHLDGEITTTYPPLVQSATDYVTANFLTATDDDFAYDVLIILLRQGAFSRTSVKEISPLDLGDFFGNVGGFWELLLIFWGLLFIATREERQPKLKARDLVKTVKNGKDILRRRSLSVDSGSSPKTGEERPAWESAFQGPNPASVPPTLPTGFGGLTTGGTAAAPEYPGTSRMHGATNGAAPGYPAMAPVQGATNVSSTATRRASTTSSCNSSGANASNGSFRHENGVNGYGSGRHNKRPKAQDMPRRGQRSSIHPPATQAPAAPGPLPPSYAAMSAAVSAVTY